MRKLLIAAATLLALFLGANVFAERAAEDALGRAAGSALGLEGPVQVDLHGFPILLDVVRGRLDGVSATVTGQRVGDLVLQRVEVTLEGLRAEGSIIGDGPLAIVADRTSITARTGAGQINAFLRRRGEDAKVKLLDGEIELTATRTVLGARRTIVATGPLRLDGRDLVFRPRDVDWDGPTVPGWERAAREAATIREELPPLPGDVRIERIAVRPDAVVLRAGLQDQRIEVR